jgi:hypothetical protein
VKNFEGLLPVKNESPPEDGQDGNHRCPREQGEGATNAVLPPPVSWLFFFHPDTESTEQ